MKHTQIDGMDVWTADYSKPNKHTLSNFTLEIMVGSIILFAAGLFTVTGLL